MDEIHFAPPKRPLFLIIPLQIPAIPVFPWYQSGAGFGPSAVRFDSKPSKTHPPLPPWRLHNCLRGVGGPLGYLQNQGYLFKDEYDSAHHQHAGHSSLQEFSDLIFFWVCTILVVSAKALFFFWPIHSFGSEITWMVAKSISPHRSETLA